MNAEQLFAAGDLTAAAKAAVDDVKRQPAELGPRYRLAEFLCLTGDLERADKQLETLLVQFPKQAMAIAQHVGMPLKIAAKVDPKDREYFREVVQPLLHQTALVRHSRALDR